MVKLNSKLFDGTVLNPISLSTVPKRKSLIFYSVIMIDMNFTISTLQRRFKVGNMPWRNLAEYQILQMDMRKQADIDRPQLIDKPQNASKFKPIKVIIKNIAEVLKALGSGNIHQISNAVGRDADIIEQHLNFMDDVQLHKTMDNVLIYSFH